MEILCVGSLDGLPTSTTSDAWSRPHLWTRVRRRRARPPARHGSTGPSRSGAGRQSDIGRRAPCSTTTASKLAASKTTDVVSSRTAVGIADARDRDRSPDASATTGRSRRAYDILPSSPASDSPSPGRDADNPPWSLAASKAMHRLGRLGIVGRDIDQERDRPDTSAKQAAFDGPGVSVGEDAVDAYGHVPGAVLGRRHEGGTSSAPLAGRRNLLGRGDGRLAAENCRRLARQTMHAIASHAVGRDLDVEQGVARQGQNLRVFGWRPSDGLQAPCPNPRSRARHAGTQPARPISAAQIIPSLAARISARLEGDGRLRHASAPARPPGRPAPLAHLEVGAAADDVQRRVSPPSTIATRGLSAFGCWRISVTLPTITRSKSTPCGWIFSHGGAGQLNALGEILGGNAFEVDQIHEPGVRKLRAFISGGRGTGSGRIVTAYTAKPVRIRLPAETEYGWA